MKIAFYCQHVLGIGHFKRSLAMCSELVKKGHQLTLILGGPPVEITDDHIEIFQLPGLEMDADFSSLIPCDKNITLDEVKAKRQQMLYRWFEDNKPEVFITELYPLGRKGFRFELDPVLKGIKEGDLAPAFCCSSVRDILVEKKEGREKFENRAVKTLNSYFQGLLIHSDSKVITLSETFNKFDNINIPYDYSGFITPSFTISKNKNKQQAQPLVIASIGGGNVGSELLEATMNAAIIADGKYQLKIFCGKYSSNKLYKNLKDKECKDISVCRFTDNFPAELAKAQLSISMAGYNTCMNVVQIGIPALFYPFAQNKEQQLRVEKFSKHANIKTISKNQLNNEKLNSLILEQLEHQPYTSKIDLNGAEKSCTILEKWFKEFKQGG